MMQKSKATIDEDRILALIDIRATEISKKMTEGGGLRVTGINDKLEQLEHRSKGQSLTDIAIIQQEITKMKVHLVGMDNEAAENKVFINELQAKFDHDYREQFQRLESQLDQVWRLKEEGKEQ